MAELLPNLMQVGDDDFDEQVLRSALPVLVEFTADWCPPCRALAPHFARLSSDYAGTLRFAKLDTDEHVEASARFGVQGIPTLVLFAGGKEVGRIVGPHPARLQQGIERLLAAVSGAATRV
jgi:thioredoxin 1